MFFDDLWWLISYSTWNYWFCRFLGASEKSGGPRANDDLTNAMLSGKLLHNDEKIHNF